MTLMRDLQDYIGTDGRHQFDLYIDIVRDLVQLAPNHDLLTIERLEHMIVDGLSLENYAEDAVEQLRAVAIPWVQAWRKCPPGSLFGDLLLIATPGVSYKDADVRLRCLADWMRQKLVPVFDVPRAEIERALRPARVIPQISDDERVAAAERIAEWLGHVIYPSRWPQLRPALIELARQHGCGPDIELRELIVARLFEVVEIAGAFSLAQGQDVKEALRAKLNTLVTEDVLGTGWRKAGVTEPLMDQHTEVLCAVTLPPKAQIEARVSVERLIEKARLTRREAEVFVHHVSMYGDAHGGLQATARDLRINPATARVHWRNAKDKLRRAAGRD